MRSDRAAAAQAARESDSVKATLRAIARTARTADERRQAEVLRLLVRSAVRGRLRHPPTGPGHARLGLSLGPQLYERPERVAPSLSGDYVEGDGCERDR